MGIIYAKGSGPIKWPTNDAHDPQSKRYYRLDYTPTTWNSNKAYTQSVSVVIPTVNNGCLYECVSGGISGLTEPVWQTVETESTIDNDVEWKCLPNTSLLRTGDTITGSTWTGDTGAVLDNGSIVGGIATKIRLTAVAAGATSVLITNHTTITRSNGDIEEFDRSIFITVKDI